jgi:hypothetical protein
MRADAWLGELVRADPDPTTRWFVLSDHGHRATGGHGDAEPEIRLVRGCIVDAMTAPGSGAVHLVDIHRALADSLALAPSPTASGRPLQFALAHPDPGATLPHPSRWRWLAALVIVLIGAVVGVRAGGARGVPLWWPIAYATIVIAFGEITLSNPVVYPPLGGKLLAAAIPGLAVLAVAIARGLPAIGMRIVVAQLALPFALAFAPAALCGALDLLVGSGGPPLVPIWTAHTSVGATLVVAGCTTAALVVGASIMFGAAAAGRGAASTDPPA